MGSEKSKRELADSMRRFSKKEEMAERLSAFQPIKLVPKSWTDKDKQQPKETKKESPVKENDEISKMIETRRNKIREERNVRKNKENRQPRAILEPQYHNLETKDTECKREIGKREEKLNKMIESSNERE